MENHKPLGDARLEEARAVLREHYPEVSIYGVARAIGVPPSSFISAIKDGLSFKAGEYLMSAATVLYNRWPLLYGYLNRTATKNRVSTKKRGKRDE